MKDLRYQQNLVCMLGYVQDPVSPLLILEYCANGDLLQFLRKNKDKFWVRINVFSNFFIYSRLSK